MKIKKAISVLLAVLMAAMLLAPAMAAPVAKKIDLFPDRLDALADRLVDGIQKKAESIDVSDFNLNENDVDGRPMQEFLSAFREDHPELFYLERFCWSVRKSIVVRIEPKYYSDYTAQDIENTNRTVEKAAALAQALGLSDADKVMLAVNFLRDRANCGGSEQGKHSTAFDALSTNQGSPYAHARALAWVLRAMGLEAYYVEGGSNVCPLDLVFVNGKGYFVDMTTTDYYWHGLLLNERRLRDDRHDLDDQSRLTACRWKSAEGYCTDGTYNDACWRAARKEMGYCGGSWYYSTGTDLYRFSFADTTTGIQLTTHNTADYLWYLDDVGAYRSCDVAAFGGYVYFTAPQAVMRYDPSTGEETVFHALTDEEKAFGEIYDLDLDRNVLSYHVSDESMALFEPGHEKYTGTLELTCDAHVFGDWTVSNPGDCVTKATEQRTCGLCGFSETREADFYGSHVFGAWHTVQAATCIAKGKETRECAKCPEQEERATDYAPHTLGAWTVTKEPTCGEPGEEKADCTVEGCTHTQTRPIPATGKHVDEDGDSVCDVCGQEIKDPIAGFQRIFARFRALLDRILAFFRNLFKINKS